MMRTLKTLAAFGALLLVASGANASVVFTLTTGEKATPTTDQEIDVTLTLTGGDGQYTQVFQFDWLLNGAAIPLSAVVLPPGGSPSGPLTNPVGGCLNPTSLVNQLQCSFSTDAALGGPNATGSTWLWSYAGTSSALDGVYAIGRFTFTSLAAGDVSVGNCFIASTVNGSTTCSSNSVALNPIPEPTTAALLGLGLFGLAIGGRRR